jgi:nitrate/nitrite transport system substrate-binding protein
VLLAVKKKTRKEATTEMKLPQPQNWVISFRKPQVTLGFIKLTDMAPLAIAKEKILWRRGLFVTSRSAIQLEKNVLDRVIDEQIDGSHMLAGQPIAAAVGFGDKLN